MGTITGPEPKGWPSWGVDLSSHNSLSSQNWEWLAHHGCRWAVPRALQPTGEPDTMFSAHAVNAEKRGLSVGGYMVLRPEQSVEAQVSTYLQTMGAIEKRPWCYAVDIEGVWSQSDKPSMVLLDACTKILKRTGRRPLIYTYSAFWRTWLARNVGLRAFPLWGAWYPTSRPGERSFDEPEKRFGRSVQVWQYGGGPVDGEPPSAWIDKNVAKR